MFKRWLIEKSESLLYDGGPDHIHSGCPRTGCLFKKTAADKSFRMEREVENNGTPLYD